MNSEEYFKKYRVFQEICGDFWCTGYFRKIDILSESNNLTNSCPNDLKLYQHLLKISKFSV